MTTNYTNYDLLDYLATQDEIYQSQWSPEWEYLGILPITHLEDGVWDCKKIEVVESYDDGRTHEWALVGEVNLGELVYPSDPEYVCLYQTIRVYGGAAEGGWYWTSAELVSVVLKTPGTKKTNEKTFLEAKARAEGMNDPQNGCGYFITEERIPGYNHTVGSRYYC